MEKYYKVVKAEDRYPETDGRYIVTDAIGRSGDLWYARDSHTHWHYLDMNGTGKTENVVFDAEYITHWLEPCTTEVTELKETVKTLQEKLILETGQTEVYVNLYNDLIGKRQITSEL